MNPFRGSCSGFCIDGRKFNELPRSDTAQNRNGTKRIGKLNKNEATQNVKRLETETTQNESAI